jgi:transcriptional regulator with XRE-family HTH domain/signal peptidase I
MINFAENLKYLRNKMGLTQIQISKELEINHTTYANYETGTSIPPLKALLKLPKYFGVTIDELVNADLSKNIKTNSTMVLNEPTTLYGLNQNPIVVTVDEHGSENIIMVDVKAAAGYATAYLEPSYFKNLPAFKIPGPQFRNGSFRAFEVSGDSMFDTLYHGDWVICQRLESLNDIREGYIHVIVTHEELSVKRILNRTKQRNKIVLKSDNEAYPPREIDVSDIQEIWLVKMFMGFNMPNRNLDVKKVLNDLQTKYLDLDSRLKKQERQVH